MSEGFNRVVLDWLNANQHPAASVESVTPYGTDWAGDTEGGFYSESDVSIRYTDADGKPQHLNVTGEEMGSLWMHVVGAWPA